MAYNFPKSLSLLDVYLQAKGHDTAKLKTDRQALDWLCRATGWRIKFPKKGKTCYTHIRRVHEQLFPLVPMPKAPSRARRVQGIGSTGPASQCRTVSNKIWNEIAKRTGCDGLLLSGTKQLLKQAKCQQMDKTQKTTSKPAPHAVGANPLNFNEAKPDGNVKNNQNNSGDSNWLQ